MTTPSTCTLGMKFVNHTRHYKQVQGGKTSSRKFILKFCNGLAWPNHTATAGPDPLHMHACMYVAQICGLSHSSCTMFIRISDFTLSSMDAFLRYPTPLSYTTGDTAVNARSSDLLQVLFLHKFLVSQLLVPSIIAIPALWDMTSSYI